MSKDILQSEYHAQWSEKDTHFTYIFWKVRIKPSQLYTWRRASEGIIQY